MMVMPSVMSTSTGGRKITVKVMKLQQRRATLIQVTTRILWQWDVLGVGSLQEPLRMSRQGMIAVEQVMVEGEVLVEGEVFGIVGFVGRLGMTLVTALLQSMKVSW